MYKKKLHKSRAEASLIKKGVPPSIIRQYKGILMGFRIRGYKSLESTPFALKKIDLEDRYPSLILLDSGRKKKRSKITENILDSNSPDIVEQIKKEYALNNGDMILINDISPLIDNFSFIDLVVEAKINFTSIHNKDLAESFCKTLLYLSNKKALGKGGNKNAYKNTVEPANEFALKMGKIIKDLEQEGYITLQQKANQLNEEGILTLRNKNWVSSTVKRTYERYLKLMAEEEENSKTTNNPNSPKPE